MEGREVSVLCAFKGERQGVGVERCTVEDYDVLCWL